MRRVTLILAATGLALGSAAPAAAAEDRSPRPTQTVERRAHLEALRLVCDQVRAEPQHAVGCAWSTSEHAAFAGYRLRRWSEATGRTTVFRTDRRDVTRFLDTGLHPGRYLYRVEVVDAGGRILGVSRVEEVAVRAG